MKRVIELGVMICAILLFTIASLDAQANNGGAPIVDIETVNVCDDGTEATMVLQFTVGSTTPIVIGYFDASGAAYTPTGTPTVGACDGSGSGASDQYSFQFMRLCDDGVPFYRLILFTNNTLPGTVTDYEPDLTTIYTVSGNVTTGQCVVESNTTLTRNLSTTTGTIAAGILSFEICNQGTEIANTTASGITTDLFPGECWSYKAVFNPVTSEYRTTPQITFDANGSRLIITTSN